MKKILLAIPDYMYEEIKKLQPYVAFTITGTIITMLDHGINYEFKKKKKYLEKEKNQQPSEIVQKTVDQDQEDNNKKIQQTLLLAKQPIKEYCESDKDYQEKIENWLREFEKFI